MSETAYKAASAARFNKAKAQEYGDALGQLAEVNGGVTAELLVVEAESPGSVFHDLFDWNDASAARMHRLKQARDLIRWIEVEVCYIGKGKPRTLDLVVTTRAYQAIDTEGGRSYQHLDVIRQNADYTRQVAQRLARELERIGEEMRLYDNLKKYATEVVRVAKKLKKGK